MKYRREIDGLRAIAVLPVIFFHAGFELFSGGFVGVDIFFVISGYLITSIILIDKDNDNFSIINFYERRARRILPALFALILVCLPFAWLWLLPSHLKDFFQSLVAVSLFSSNVLFWAESGYFDAAAELKPLLHTWSLAVEEQYYVLYPLFLIIMWKLRKIWIFISLSMITLISFCLAIWMAYNKPFAAFFLLPARIWELTIGGLVAFLLVYRKQYIDKIIDKMIVREVFGILGAALIFYSIFTFDKNTPFPSHYTLLPTMGTALIILFSNNKFLVGRLLGASIMVSIGLVSYSTYLWHQPIFSFARHWSIDRLGSGELLMLSAASILMGYASLQFVEKPFRNKKFISRKAIFSFVGSFSIVFIAIGLIVHFSDGFPERYKLPTTLIQSMSRTDLSKTVFDKSNLDTEAKWYNGLGNHFQTPEFVLFGDSHALSLYDVFDTAAKKTNSEGIFTGASGCLPFLDIYTLRDDQGDRDCKALNNRVYDFVKENNIKNVFLVARWSYYTDGDYTGNEFSHVGLTANVEKSSDQSRKAFEFGFHQTLQKYRDIGVDIFLISQVPQQIQDPEKAYTQIYNHGASNNIIDNVSVTRNQHVVFQSFVKDMFLKNDGFNVIDVDKLFCNDDRCKIGTKYSSYYWDDDHLSISGSLILLDDIVVALKSDSAVEEI